MSHYQRHLGNEMSKILLSSSRRATQFVTRFHLLPFATNFSCAIFCRQLFSSAACLRIRPTFAFPHSRVHAFRSQKDMALDAHEALTAFCIQKYKCLPSARLSQVRSILHLRGKFREKSRHICKVSFLPRIFLFP